MTVIQISNDPRCPCCLELSNDKLLQIAEDQSHNNSMNSCDIVGLVKMEDGEIAQQPVKRQTLKLRFGS